MMRMQDINLSGKRVLIREDLNVPLENGNISDDTRIKAALPTIKNALTANARVMVVSHLGRPKEGQYDPSASLEPVAKRLTELLGQKVSLIKDWVNGVHVEPGSVVLCENVRFEFGEEKNDDQLSRKLASLCDVFVNDAFATAHRAQASTHGIAKYAPQVCGGPLLMSEIDALTKALSNPERPMIAVVGGSKVSTKLEVLESLVKIVDQLIIGGGIMNTFLKAAGYSIGKSLYEDALVETAQAIIKQATARGATIPLATDVVCAKEFKPDALATIKDITAVEADDMILDIGPNTVKVLTTELNDAKTIVWNGPVGVFEFDQFADGTKAISEAIANSAAFSLAGGGDTIAAISKFGIEEKISYISTAGGAFLEFLEGKTLPAIAILQERDRANPNRIHPSEGY